MRPWESVLASAGAGGCGGGSHGPRAALERECDAGRLADVRRKPRRDRRHARRLKWAETARFRGAMLPIVAACGARPMIRGSARAGPCARSPSSQLRTASTGTPPGERDLRQPDPAADAATQAAASRVASASSSAICPRIRRAPAARAHTFRAIDEMRYRLFRMVQETPDGHGRRFDSFPLDRVPGGDARAWLRQRRCRQRR